MWEEIVLMFNTMQWYIYIPLILGVILMVIECFVPGFGIFGISGIITIVGAIVAQGILFQSVAQVLFLISLALMAIILIFLIFLRSARFGLVGKTPFIQNRTAIPTDYDSLNKNELKVLIGQRGVTVSTLRPVGKFVVNKVIYDGISEGQHIDKDVIVKVVAVEGNKIIIEKVEV